LASVAGMWKTIEKKMNDHKKPGRIYYVIKLFKDFEKMVQGNKMEIYLNEDGEERKELMEIRKKSKELIEKMDEKEKIIELENMKKKW